MPLLIYPMLRRRKARFRWMVNPCRAGLLPRGLTRGFQSLTSVIFSFRFIVSVSKRHPRLTGLWLAPRNSLSCPPAPVSRIGRDGRGCRGRKGRNPFISRMISSIFAALVKKFRQAERDPGPFPKALTGWFSDGAVNGPFFLRTRLAIEHHFRLPTASMRRELFALHLTQPGAGEGQSAQSRGPKPGPQRRGHPQRVPERLNAIHAGSRDPDPAKWVVTEEMLVREIRRARAAKARHGGKVSGRRIGFQRVRRFGFVSRPPAPVSRVGWGWRGSRTAWRIHYSLRMPQMVCDHYELTDTKGGEKFGRFTFAKGELVIADRGYSHRAGVAHIIDSRGEVLVRWNPSSLPLETSTGRSTSLLGWLRRLPAHGLCEKKV